MKEEVNVLAVDFASIELRVLAERERQRQEAVAWAKQIIAHNARGKAEIENLKIMVEFLEHKP